MTTKTSQKQLRELIAASTRMLRLKTVEEVCRHTAESVVEHSLFQRCVVSLLEEDGTFRRLGFGGLTKEEIRKLEEMPRSTLESMEERLIERFRIGRSYYLPHSEVEMQGLQSKKAPTVKDDGWHPDDFLFIPLFDPDERIVGLISVDDPSDGLKPTEEKLLPLELFATHIAAILESLRNVGKLQEMIHKLRDQQEVVLELSTPVIKIWDQVLVLPLIGSVDSARAQQIMENVLEEINATRSRVIIIDITGVPLIDTLVASHLVKTVTAARLLGAQTIITGINPEVAQTLVHLGVDLSEIVTKSNLARGIEEALSLTGKQIVAVDTH
ncbi:MAG TPA: STAS domain-containing protein [Bacteroidetes bacterium]|nr:STAS domain-containing protein [Bacteroidota bacterium]